MNRDKLEKTTPRLTGRSAHLAPRFTHHPKTLFLAAAIGLTGTLLATIPSASAWTAVVYKDKDFLGIEASLNEGSYTLAQLNAAGMSNDAISSLRIKPGYKIVLYRDDNFKGETATYFWDDKWSAKSGLQDQASSIKVVKLTAPYTDSSVYRVYNYYDEWKRSEILKMYAPRLVFDTNEIYLPSSLGWNAKYTTRMLKSDGYIREAIESMPDSLPAKKLAYFSGNYDTRTTYAFWSAKDLDCIDLSYWTFYPYNRGKVILNTDVGDHVGDWEHVTVRLIHWENNGGHYIRPTNVCYQAHNVKNLWGWEEVEKRDGTHPVAYVAHGSHGVWRDTGPHTYEKAGAIYSLVDYADGGGRQWNTWESGSFYTYEFYRLNETNDGLGATGETTVWDYWDYSKAGKEACIRWGNNRSTTTFAGQDRRSSGPTGPEKKNALQASRILE